MKSLLHRSFALTAALILSANLCSAAEHGRVRLINTAPYASIVSLTVDDKKIATLVPPGEARKFKKMHASTYTAHVYDGVTEAVTQPLQINAGLDYSILPYLEAGKPKVIVAGMAKADKTHKTGGRTVFLSAITENAYMYVFVDNLFKGLVGYGANFSLPDVADGTHTISFRDPNFLSTIASGSVYIHGGSNNIVVLTGSINPQDQSPLVVHAYGDKDKY